MDGNQWIWCMEFGFLQFNPIFLNVVQVWFYSQWKPSWNFHKEKFKVHFHFGYKMTLSGIMDTIFNNLYPILIGKYYPIADVGFYQRADSLKQLPVTNLGAIVSRVTYPLFAEIQDDNVRLKDINRRIMQMVVFTIAPTLSIMGALATPLFRFLFTDKWLPAVPFFRFY